MPTRKRSDEGPPPQERTAPRRKAVPVLLAPLLGELACFRLFLLDAGFIQELTLALFVDTELTGTGFQIDDLHPGIAAILLARLCFGEFLRLLLPRLFLLLFAFAELLLQFRRALGAGRLGRLSSLVRLIRTSDTRSRLGWGRSRGHGSADGGRFGARRAGRLQIRGFSSCADALVHLGLRTGRQDRKDA